MRSRPSLCHVNVTSADLPLAACCLRRSGTALDLSYFFDHMGPAELLPGAGIDVRPHPHIGLATVTYLFAGSIVHRDSLGNLQAIEPGAVNWMTAGRGIVHSERSDSELRKTRQKLHGIQLWVALPKHKEETDA